MAHLVSRSTVIAQKSSSSRNATAVPHTQPTSTAFAVVAAAHASLPSSSSSSSSSSTITHGMVHHRVNPIVVASELVKSPAASSDQDQDNIDTVLDNIDLQAFLNRYYP